MEPRWITKVIIEDWPATPQGDILMQHLKAWAYCFVLCGEIKESSIPMIPVKW
jgi:hypothetical protein